MSDCSCGRDKSKWSGNDLIPAADAHRHERKQQRIGTRRATHGKFASHQAGNLPLEGGNLRPKNELLAGKNLGDCGKDFLADRMEFRS